MEGQKMIRPSLNITRMLIVLTLFIFCSIFGFPFGGDKITGSLIDSASAQTAEYYFQQGKTYLENDSLINAHTNFQNALSLDPNHQGANLFYAITRILMTSTSSDFNTLLDRSNVNSSGRDILNWQADFQRDYKGNVILPPNTPTGGEIQAFLMNSIAPEVDGAITNLSKVGNTYQTTYDWTIGNGSGLVSSPNTLADNTKNWNFNEWVGTKIAVEGYEYTITSNTYNTLFVSPNWIISPGTYSYKVFERISIDHGDMLVLKGFLYLA
jgi:hypothetical protein